MRTSLTHQSPPSTAFHSKFTGQSEWSAKIGRAPQVAVHSVCSGCGHSCLLQLPRYNLLCIEICSAFWHFVQTLASQEDHREFVFTYKWLEKLAKTCWWVWERVLLVKVFTLQSGRVLPVSVNTTADYKLSTSSSPTKYHLSALLLITTSSSDMFID